MGSETSFFRCSINVMKKSIFDTMKFTYKKPIQNFKGMDVPYLWVLWMLWFHPKCNKIKN